MTVAAGQRILVVDDDPGIRRALFILLTREGYQVTQAQDGVEALRVWRDQGGDLVITDLHMPEKNGIETSAGQCHDARCRTDDRKAVYAA